MCREVTNPFEGEYSMTVAQHTAREWLGSLPRFGIRPGLIRTQRVLQALDHPESSLRFFHVAGTNGKGSVCSFLHALLSVHQRVGLFTSPAYDNFRARFRIGDVTIAETEFVELAHEVMVVSQRVTTADPITEFEALTVMAILFFARHAVDAVVWETGLGGRFDCTNVVSPVVTAITNVGLDHTEILGHTHRAIAADKAGIIKSGIPMITAAQDGAMAEIVQQAAHQGAPLHRYGVDFQVVQEQVRAHGQLVSYRGLRHDIYDIALPLFGAHQCANAAVALAMLESADSRSQRDWLSAAEIRTALAGVRWPGRFEQVLVGTTQIVLDGAHNADGARAFAHALARYDEVQGRTPGGWTMVIGILADKDASAMLHALLPFAGRVIAVAPDNARALPASQLSALVQTLRPDLPVHHESDVGTGFLRAMGDNLGARIACWGSLYTVDAVRKVLRTTYGIDMMTTG